MPYKLNMLYSSLAILIILEVKSLRAFQCLELKLSISPQKDIVYSLSYPFHESQSVWGNLPLE